MHSCAQTSEYKIYLYLFLLNLLVFKYLPEIHSIYIKYVFKQFF